MGSICLEECQNELHGGASKISWGSQFNENFAILYVYHNNGLHLLYVLDLFTTKIFNIEVHYVVFLVKFFCNGSTRDFLGEHTHSKIFNLLPICMKCCFLLYMTIFSKGGKIFQDYYHL